MSEWEPRVSARLDEMSGGKRSLYMEIHPDGDIVVCIHEDGAQIENNDGTKASVEFCNTAGGGGESPHTRRALHALFDAMLRDAEEKPAGIPPYPVWLSKQMTKVHPEKIERLLNLTARDFFTAERMEQCGIKSKSLRTMAMRHAIDMAKTRMHFDGQRVQFIDRPRILSMREFVTEYKDLPSILRWPNLGEKSAAALITTITTSGLQFSATV